MRSKTRLISAVKTKRANLEVFLQPRYAFQVNTMQYEFKDVG